mmetsp:Transcript_14090/g.42624  ORF Transcript_14090/g.42624 Transcript_14090/m.42624 type:complete len:134 (+) Transcript_14090:850-1251(+)
MGAADFVRNLVLGSFEREADAVREYESAWLPQVEAPAAAAAAAQARSVASVLEAFFGAFLASEGLVSSGKEPHANDHALTSGPLYPRFRAWWQAALDDHLASSPDADHERIAALLLARLAAFARHYFSAASPP